MAFEREDDVTKDAIAGFEIRFLVPSPSSGDPTTSLLRVQIELSSGQHFLREYDLIVRLNDDPAGQAHLANLIDLRDYIRTRLENEVLPL